MPFLISYSASWGKQELLQTSCCNTELSLSTLAVTITFLREKANGPGDEPELPEERAAGAVMHRLAEMVSDGVP